jgi:hypothetical protein
MGLAEQVTGRFPRVRGTPIAMTTIGLRFWGEKGHEKVELFASLGRYTLRVAHFTQVAWFQCRSDSDACLEYRRDKRDLQYYQ